MVYLYRDGVMHDMTANPPVALMATPPTALDVCRAILGADENWIEAAAEYDEGTAGCTMARHFYAQPKDLG